VNGVQSIRTPRQRVLPSGVHCSIWFVLVYLVYGVHCPIGLVGSVHPLAAGLASTAARGVVTDSKNTPALAGS